MPKRENPATSTYTIVRHDRQTGEHLEVERIKGQGNAEWLVQKLNRELQQKGGDKNGQISHYWK